jgi:hypothetical protein
LRHGKRGLHRVDGDPLYTAVSPNEHQREPDHEQLEPGAFHGDAFNPNVCPDLIVVTDATIAAPR